MDNDYIVLTEDFLNWRWFKFPKVTHVFIYLLLFANTKAQYHGKDKIRRGSIVTTNECIANECGLTIQNVRTALSNLEQTGEITRERRNRYQIITITNYEQYKDDI